jgi:transglutaminase-like putative cysteine protease
VTVRVVHAAAYTFQAAVTGLQLDLRLSPAPWEVPRTRSAELAVVPSPSDIATVCDRWGNTVRRASFGRPVARVSIAMHVVVNGLGCDLPVEPATPDDVLMPEDAPAGVATAGTTVAPTVAMREECAGLTDGWRFEANLGGDGATIAELLRDRRGRCLELARLLVWRLRLRSIPARFVLGYALEPTTRGAIRQRHAWVAYHDGRRWSTVDPSAPGRGAGDLFATAWGPRLAPLMPVRVRQPAGLTGIAGTWSTQVTVV